jgi:hypothetical protein
VSQDVLDVVDRHAARHEPGREKADRRRARGPSWVRLEDVQKFSQKDGVGRTRCAIMLSRRPISVASPNLVVPRGGFMFRIFRRSSARRGRPALSTAGSEISQHIPFHSDGRGVTVEMWRSSEGLHTWRWRLDPGLPDDLMHNTEAMSRITAIEKSLGLKLTFPHLDPDALAKKKQPLTTEQKEAERRELVDRAGRGDPHSKVKLWRLDGEPITDPANLIEGSFYFASGLSIYVCPYVGRRWSGIDEEDPGEHGSWFSFEPTACDLEHVGIGTVRLDADDFAAKPSRVEGELFYPVVKPRVSDAEVREVFDELRRLHHDWLRRQNN